LERFVGATLVVAPVPFIFLNVYMSGFDKYLSSNLTGFENLSGFYRSIFL
jgi:hypothetical protein